MCNMMMDGPPELEIDGDRICVKGTSGGEPVCYTYRLADALVAEHRFQQVKAKMLTSPCAVVPFPQRAHAETA